MEFATAMRRIAIASADLPVLRLLSQPLYKRAFAANTRHNLFLGVYPSFEAAARAAPTNLPMGYDNPQSADRFRNRLDSVRVSDYPAMFWLQRMFQSGCTRVFDLGGHVGVAYYAFRRFIDYPNDLDWCVCDVPAVVEAGREWARSHDPSQSLRLSDDPADASGADVLLAMGSLQFLDYTLPQLFERLESRPRFLIISQTPLHPQRSFFTLNSTTVSFCPYRITAKGEFNAGLERAGYTLQTQWESEEKQVSIPFHREYAIDHYSGSVWALAQSEKKAG